jgi:hypothetical protein
MKSWVHLLLLSLMTITAESSWADCTHYASPTGGGNGLSASSPFRVADFYGVAGPGKTLCLLDGTYQGDSSVIKPPNGLSGVSGNPITIRALNDGGVTIDGQFQRRPVFLYHNSWWLLEGFNAKQSRHEVIYLDHSNNNIFRRIVAWDAWMLNNSIVILPTYESTDNLFEDVAAFGTGRKVLDGGGHRTTYRRVWARWEGSVSTGPKMTTQFSYGTDGESCENCMLTFSAESMPDSYNLDDDPTHDRYSGGRIQDGNSTIIQTLDIFTANSCSNVNILGTLAYLNAADKFPYMFLIWNYVVDCIRIKDTMALISPSNPRYNDIGGFFLSNGPNHANLTATNITSVRSPTADPAGAGGPDFFLNWAVSGKSVGATINDVPSPWAATTTGANLCYRYVNGTKTNQPLWPWPMNERIKAATASAGATSAPCTTCSGGRQVRTATDVQADIEALVGTIPAQCKGPSPSPSPAPAPAPNPSPSYSCQGGVLCDGSRITGSPGQVVCGADFRNYICTNEGWVTPGTACTCGGSGTDTIAPTVTITSPVNGAVVPK